MLLYLVRHAQTSSSAIDAFNGQAELPLTDQGREQARKLGRRLEEVRFAATYCSPLSRTRDTAQLVAPGREPVVVPGLIEINYGEWEGHTPAQVQQSNPERYAAWVKDPIEVAPPGGETVAQVATRALHALEWIQALHEVPGGKHGPVLVVSHKATLRIIGAALMSSPLTAYRARWPQDECALNVVELRHGKKPFLRVWNDTSHLGADPGQTTRGGK